VKNFSIHWLLLGKWLWQERKGWRSRNYSIWNR